MIVLIDTCIVIDALTSRKPFNTEAEKIFMGSANNQFEGIISTKSISDIYYLIHKYTHDDKKTRKAISELLLVFDLIDTSGADIRRALNSKVSDYEDAIIIESAKRVEADYIVTRNIKDFKNSEITVLTPNQFLEALDSKSFA